MPVKSTASKSNSFAAANKELWLLLSIFVLAALVNKFVASQQVILGLYMLPTLFSAYSYGRRHAVMTSLGSIVLVVLVTYFHPIPNNLINVTPVHLQQWFDLAAWGGILMITGYTMGSLYERVKSHLSDLEGSYEGMTALLQQLISNSKLGQNSRLALCATKIAETMGLPFERVEDIRAAAMLEDMEKSGVSTDLFMKAAGLEGVSYEELAERIKQAPAGKGSALKRAIPILLAFHDAKSGRISGSLPVEVQVLMLASLYETGSQGTRFSPSQVIEKIATQKRFDGEVVEGFKHAFA
jgi:K+-sensing histidine kinase KdpD